MSYIAQPAGGLATLRAKQSQRWDPKALEEPAEDEQEMDLLAVHALSHASSAVLARVLRCVLLVALEVKEEANLLSFVEVEVLVASS